MCNKGLPCGPRLVGETIIINRQTWPSSHVDEMGAVKLARRVRSRVRKFRGRRGRDDGCWRDDLGPDGTAGAMTGISLIRVDPSCPVPASCSGRCVFPHIALSHIDGVGF